MSEGIFIAEITLLIALGGWFIKHQAIYRKYFRVIHIRGDKLDIKKLLNDRPNEEYYPRPDIDSQINESIRKLQNVLIIGKSLSGKTRAVLEALRTEGADKIVSIPALDPFSREDMRYFDPASQSDRVVFIDDLQRFVEQPDFDFALQEFQSKAKMIIASCRSEFELEKTKSLMSAKNLSLKGLFEQNVLHIPDINENEARKVADKYSKPWQDVEFDHTIGSVFMRLDEMRKRFKDLETDEKEIMRALRDLYLTGAYHGEQVFPRAWVALVCKDAGVSGEKKDWNKWLGDLKEREFIHIDDDDTVRAEEAYLEHVVRFTFEHDGDNPLTVRLFERHMQMLASEPKALLSVCKKAYDVGMLKVERMEYMKLLIRELKSLVALPESAFDLELRADAYRYIGDALDEIAEHGEAIEFYEKAIHIYLKIHKENHPDTATAYNNIGMAWRAKGEYDKALEFYGKSLDIKLKVYGEVHPSTATSYNNIGGAWDSKGEYGKALEFYGKSLDIRLKVNGEVHPSTATSYNNIGSAWNEKGEYDKALEFHDKALKIRLKVFGEEHPDTATSYNNIGMAWKAKGEYDKALENVSKTLSIFERILGPNHPNTKIVRANRQAIIDKINSTR